MENSFGRRPAAAETNAHLTLIILLWVTSLTQGQMYVALSENGTRCLLQMVKQRRVA